MLDLTHDPHAKPALRSYAASARADGYELLANDLERIAGAAPSTPAVIKQAATEILDSISVNDFREMQRFSRKDRVIAILNRYFGEAKQETPT